MGEDLPSDVAELRELVGRLLRRIAELEGRERQHLRRIGRIEQLESRLRRDSSTSSRPPSSDAPWSKRRGHRRPPSGKKQGAQPGHPGKTRNLVDPGDVDEIVNHEPSACRTWGHDELVDSDLAPRRHQVTEISPLLATITEHRLHGRLCRHCGDEVFADLPEGVSPSAFGPRLQALVVTLVAAYQLSRSEAARLLSEAFDVKISVGSVSNIERRMSRALEAAFERTLEPLRGTAALSLHNVRPLLRLVRLVQRGARVSPCWTTISRCFGSKRPEVQILSPRPLVTIAARASYGDFARPIRTPRFRPIPATAALPLQIVTRPTGAIDAVRWRSPSSASHRGRPLRWGAWRRIPSRSANWPEPWASRRPRCATPSARASCGLRVGPGRTTAREHQEPDCHAEPPPNGPCSRPCSWLRSLPPLDSPSPQARCRPTQRTPSSARRPAKRSPRTTARSSMRLARTALGRSSAL